MQVNTAILFRGNRKPTVPGINQKKVLAAVEQQAKQYKSHAVHPDRLFQEFVAPGSPVREAFDQAIKTLSEQGFFSGESLT